MTKSNIRILHLVSSLDKDSGVMSVIMNYYKNIDRKKFQFDFVFFIPNVSDDKSSYEKEIKYLGGNCTLITSPKNMVKFLSQLKMVIKNNDYPILHNHEVYLTNIIKNMILRKHCKIITHSHTTSYSDKKLSALRNYILTLGVGRFSDYNIACSTEAGRHLFKKNDFRLLYNAIEFSKYVFNENSRALLRKRYNMENKVVIGHIGRFNKQKNHMFILEIIKNINNPNIHFCLIGEGPLKEQILYLIKNDKELKDKVTILDFKENIGEYMSMFDYFILPSLYEGLPMIGIEAQINLLNCTFSNKITKEVSISNTCVFLDLNTQKWIDHINGLLLKNMDRTNVSLINYEQFNIKRVVLSLEKIYTGLVE